MEEGEQDQPNPGLPREMRNICKEFRSLMSTTGVMITNIAAYVYAIFDALSYPMTGLNAVTSIREFSRYSAIFFSFTSVPSTE